MYSIPNQVYDRKANKYCSVLMQSLQVLRGDTEWSPQNVNTGSEAVKLLWLRGKDDISIMLSQQRCGPSMAAPPPCPKSSLCRLLSSIYRRLTG